MSEILVFGNRLIQIVPNGQDFAVHNSLEWQNDITDAVTLNYSWDGMNFVPPPPLSLADAKNAAKSAIDALKEQKKALPILSEGFTVDANSLSSGAMASTSFALGSTAMAISSLTFSGGVVTAVTDKNHHMIDAQTAAITLAVEVDYNGSFAVTVIDKTTFTYTIAGTPSTPATGTPVANVSTIPWFDNTMTQRFWALETFDDICRDVVKYLQDLTIRENELNVLVDASITVAEVEAIDITTGWPITGL